MEGLSQEEKVRAYNEALERARKLRETCGSNAVVGWCEYIFPELKESEDECIRKDIITYLVQSANSATLKVNAQKFNKWVAWLEKQGEASRQQRVEEAMRELGEKSKIFADAHQGKTSEEILAEMRGEQKPADKAEPKFKVGDKIFEKDFYECGCGTITDIKEGKYIFDNGCSIFIEEQGLWQLVEQKLAEKVEPKFKVGDWVVFNNKHQSIYQVEKIEDGYYILRHTHGGTFRVCVLHDESLRLWTIQDAKDGDLIYDGNAACIFRNTMEDDDAIWVDTYCGINIDNEFKVNDEDECWCLSKDCSPATKEQRDTLMKAMADAGYVFDFGKKELKEIEKNTAWSEEDDNRVSEIIEYLNELYNKDRFDLDELNDKVNWLKSAKQRLGGEK